jgi:PAS domain S-box-containing protein
VATDYVFSSALAPDGQLALNWVAGAFEKITGYTFDEYVARGGWQAMVHPDDRAQDARDLETLRANRPLRSELRTLAKDGRTVWWKWPRTVW